MTAPIKFERRIKKKRTSHLSSQGMRSEINVTPLVDVVLVLLIIFMVVTPMLSRGIKVDLPETVHHEKREDSGEQIVVSIGRDGRAFIGSDEANDANFPALMRKALSGKSHEVHVKADKSLEYGRVRGILEKIHDAGSSSVALGTDEKKEPPR